MNESHSSDAYRHENVTDAGSSASGDEMPRQPCSGNTIVSARAFGAGASGASPDYVCIVKPPARSA